MHVPATLDFSRYGIASHWYRQSPANQTLLFVYAHPDDESFGNAGTILRYSDAATAVHYACATRGEAGVVSEAHLRGYPDIGALRTQEMLKAAAVLGLASVHFLGHRDSGMAGSPDNDHPQSLVQAPRALVAGQVTALIRALRPQVVITFGPYGGYGHPDHIAIHFATMDAFRAASDPTQYPEQLTGNITTWQPSKLYYSTFATGAMRLLLTMMRLTGRDPRKVGANGDIDFVRAVDESTPITTSIASNAFLERKERAWDAHQSQLGGASFMRKLPAFLRRRVNGSEHFTRIVPPWDETRRLEHDLFEGIQ